MKMRITAWLDAIQKSLGLREDERSSPSDATSERAAVADHPIDPPAALRERSVGAVSRTSESVSRRVKAADEYVSLKAGDLFADLMRIPPAAWRTVFAAEALRGLLIGLTGVVEELRRVRGGGDMSAALADLTRRCREAHAAGVLRISAVAAPIEQPMRWLAWALDAPQPWTLRPHITGFSEGTRLLDQLRGSMDEPVVVVWASGSPLPESLAERAQSGEVALLLPETASQEESLSAWTAIGGAEVEALAVEPGSRRTEWLPATAAFVQAILRGRRTGWVPVRLPVGVLRLEVIGGLREARSVREQRCVGMLRLAHGSDEFVVPPLFAPRERPTSGQTWVLSHVAR